MAFKAGKYTEAVDLYTKAIGAQKASFQTPYLIICRAEPARGIIPDESGCVVHGA